MNKERQKLFEAFKTIREYCVSRRCPRDCIFDDGDRCLFYGMPDLWPLKRAETILNSVEAENDC